MHHRYFKQASKKFYRLRVDALLRNFLLSTELLLAEDKML